MSKEQTSQFLEWKPPTYDHRQVFKACLAAAKRYHKKMNMYKRVEDGKLAGKIILFQFRGTGGSVIEKYLEIYGCPDIAHVETEEQLFDIVSSIPVLGIMFWYASDARKCVDVIHRLHANRQLDRRPIMVIYPGEEALSSLQAIEKPILYDFSEPIPYSRLEFASRLEDWFAKSDDQTDPRVSLMNVRRQIRGIRAGAEVSLNEQEIISSLQPLMSQSKGQFWIDVELVAFHMATGAWDKADQRIMRLETDYADFTLLPNLMRANLIAAKGNTIEACRVLIERVKGRVLSDDQMLQIGRQVVRWKDQEPLVEFLNYWHEQAGAQRGYAYSFLVASYFRLTHNYVAANEYLKHALAKAPFRWEFLSAMAENRLIVKDYRMAEHYWIVARHHPFADSLAWAIGLIRSHYGQRRVRYADGLLAKMLKKYPQDPRLLKLKAVFVDGRLDQLKESS